MTESTTLVEKRWLQGMSVDGLKSLAKRKLKIPHNGNKDDLIQRILKEKPTLADLQKDDMFRICDSMDWETLKSYDKPTLVRTILRNKGGSSSTGAPRRQNSSDSTHKSPRPSWLTYEVLDLLSLEELKAMCGEHDLPISRNKAPTIEMLLENVTVAELRLRELQIICERLNLPVSGTKSVLIDRIQNLKGGKKPQSEGEGGQAQRPAAHPTSLAHNVLKFLTVPELQSMCLERSLSSSGNKEAIIKRLADGFKLEDLFVYELSFICTQLDCPASGKKAELIDRINRKAGQAQARPTAAEERCQMERAQERERELEELLEENKRKSKKIRELEKEITDLREFTEELQRKNKEFEQMLEASQYKVGPDYIHGYMSRKTYRNRLERLGLVESDQDVFHIVAKDNGGADHTDNYWFVVNSKLNRAIGNRHDNLNAYLAGMERTTKAVSISMKHGYKSSVHGTAEQLYARGATIFKQVMKLNCNNK